MNEEALQEEEFVEEVEAEEAVDQDILDEATQGGWRPVEEFHGNEEDWVDAETFVRRGREINPILRKNNERLTSQLKVMQAQMEQQAETMQEFREFTAQSREAERQTYMEQLRGEKRDALESGDVDALLEVDEKILEAQQEPEEEEDEPEVQYDPVFTRWADQNEWYSTNVDMHEYADYIAPQLQRKGAEGAELLDQVKAAVEKQFPQEFGRPKKLPTVETGRPVKAGKNRYNDLPAEAKAACDRFVSDIPGYTQEDYLADYDWSN